MRFTLLCHFAPVDMTIGADIPALLTAAPVPFPAAYWVAR
jgi:hypothetical protein